MFKENKIIRRYFDIEKNIIVIFELIKQVIIECYFVDEFVFQEMIIYVWIKIICKIEYIYVQGENFQCERRKKFVCVNIVQL